MTWVVVSLGGSLIVPKEGIDVQFLRSFRKLLLELIEEGHKFLLITGGGTTCRKYQQAAAAICDVPAEDLDWLGIHSTRLNAHLVRTIFREESSPRIITNPRDDPLPEEDSCDIIVGAGWRPGWSTDYDAAMLAKRLGAKRVINLSNTPYVYAEDPRENPAAERFEEMSWQELRSIIGDDWKPGLNVPFDPIAAKLCQEHDLEVAILSAESMENVSNALLGKEFKGTIIKN